MKSLASLFPTIFINAESSYSPNLLDKYGGCKNIKFKATGFFRTEFDGKRWWLVTPLGHGFITFGINHYHASWWAQEHNRQYWLERFHADKQYDKKWIKGFRDEALNDLRRLGINSLGVHTDSLITTEAPRHALLPYVATYSPLKLSHYLNPSKDAYIDVFSKEFRIICDNEAEKKVLPFADDPMILGFCMSDCPIFTDDEAKLYDITTWPRQIRNMGRMSPGKNTYVNLVSKIYSDIKNFNLEYQTNFTSWDKLLEAENWRKDNYPKTLQEKKDNHCFLLLCIDQYYKRAKESFKKYDQNHLFFGDKLNGNTNGLDSVIKVTSRYTDLINFQYYASLEDHKESMKRWSSLKTIEQPILNGDSAFTVPTETMPNPHGPHCQSQKERAEMTIEFMKNSLQRNDFIGWHMCGIIDTTKTMPTKELSQHQGIMSIKGVYYREMERALQYISNNLYNFTSPTEF